MEKLKVKELDEEKLSTNLIINNAYCKDDTKRFINSINTNIVATIKNAKYIKIKNKRFYVNNTNKIIHEFNEISVAKWIQKKLHKNVEFLPNISEVDSIKLGDFRIDGKEIWELKTIIGSGKRTLDYAIKKKKGQASIFIFDLTYSKIKNIEAIIQAINIFRRRKWVNKVILKRNDAIIKVLTKKEIDYRS